MQEVILTYQCGKQVKEVGLIYSSESNLLAELEDESTKFINLQMIDGKNITLSKDTIISITYRN